MLTDHCYHWCPYFHTKDFYLSPQSSFRGRGIHQTGGNWNQYHGGWYQSNGNGRSSCSCYGETKLSYTYLCLEDLFNDEISEHNIGINIFEYTMTKERCLIPKGVPENCLHKIKTLTEQPNKVARLIEPIFGVSKFYLEEDYHKLYSRIHVSF